MRSVHNGERELRMPFTELLLFVIDKANKKAGAPLPKIPICRIVKYFSRGIVRSALIANGREHKNDMLTRRAAN